MRAPTGSGRRLLVPRLAVAGCVLAVMAGCSGSAEAPAAPTTGVTTPAVTASDVPEGEAVTPPAGGTVFQISVAGNRVAPKPGRHTVKAGQPVRLILTTDKANVVHVHGADVEREVEPGAPLTLDFTVDQPGVYPVELHEPELLLMQIVVR
jgi:plastocyanin